ncbi:gp58-like family protein [Streptococcus pluranimalium]|uniref:gp58-like family protein n=1 Tax=Streptococcus pluranimalium TaxID=82348 RepID=UPI003F693A65
MEIKTSKGVYYVNADYTIEEKQGEYSKLTCTIPSAKNKSWIDDCKELDRLYTPGEQDEFVIINPVKITKGDSYGLEITAVGAFEFDFVKSRIDDNLPTRSYTVEYLLDLVFKDTRYSYDLQGTYEKREFTNFGSGSRYKLFLQIMNRFNLEFKVIGKIVRINSKVGNDTGFQFRYLKNIKDTKYSVDATNLVTHVKGYGAYHDANDQSKGRLEVEYLSPLSDIYGKLSGEPVVDERMSISDTLLEKCKQSVESSVAVTVSTTLVALKNQEYRGVARVGDSIWFIDERIDLEKKIRFSTVKSYYDAFDELIKQDVQLGDKDVFSRAQSSDSASQSKLIDMQKELSDQLADVEDAIKKTYVMPSGVNRVFYSSDLPEDVPKGTIKEGDTLFRNIDGETKMYRWDGVQWELVPVVNDVESFKKDIDSQFKTVTETMQRNDAEHQKGIDDLLAKASVNKSLADEAKSISNQAKLDAATALTSAQTAKSEAIAEAKRLDTIDRQATEIKLSTAKSQAIAEAQRLDTIEREATETKLATTKSQAVAEADKLVNDAKTTLETEISNAKQSIAEAKEALESQISGVSTEVTKTNDTIKTLATKTDVDSTNKRLTSAETTIKQQAGQIAQKANQIAVDMLSGRVTKAETSLTQQADEIALKANTSDVNTLTNRVTKAEASVKVNASQIALKANQTEVDSVKSRLQNAESSLTVQAKEIAQRVKTSDFNQAKQRLATAESKITQLGDKITTEISETVAKIPTEIGGRNYILDSQTQKVYSNNNILYPITSEIKTENEKSFIRVKRIEVEKSPGSFSIYTAISRLSEDVKLLEKGIVSFKARASHNLRFKTMIATKKNNGTTENGDNREITISQNWQTFSFSLPLGSDISLIRANPMTVSTDISAFVEDFYLDLCDWKLEGGYIATDWSPAPEDTLSEIESVKTTINQTARGQEQLSTQLTQAQGKVTTAETRINQLVGEVSSKVSQIDFNKLNNTVSSQATTLTQQAKQILLKADKSYVDNVKQIVDKTAAELIVANNAINQRVTQTTFNQATKRLTNAETTIKTIAGQIDTKLSRTDADKIVTNAITQSERGTIQRISEVEGKIPTSIGGRNLLLNSDFEKVAKGDSFTVNGQVYDTTATNWGTYNGGMANAKTSYHAYVADYAGRKNAVVYNETNGSRNWKAIHQSLGSRIPQTTNNFILSADVFVTGAGTKLFGGFYYFDKSGKQNFHSGQFQFDTSRFEIGKWQRVSVAVPFEKEKADFSKDIRFYIYAYNFSTNAILAIDDVQLETGKIATGHSLAPEEFATTAAVHEIRQTVDAYSRTISEQGKSISQVVQTAQGLVSRVDNVQSGISTVQSQLAGSWAVKHLTSAGRTISEINLGADGINRFHGLLTHISGQTLIDRAVIKDAHIGSVSASKMTTGTLDAGKVNVINLNANKIVGLDANFLKSKIELAIIDWMRGKTISAQNDAMKINLNSGQTLYYTDQAAIKRILSGYPTQFVKFATGTVSGKGNAGVTVIGSNRSGTESSNDGGFVGIRAWNGSNIDQIDVVGDHVRLASSAYNSADGWDIITLPNRLEIDAYNANHRASSRVKVGDVWLWKNASTYSSMRETINLIIDNLQLLHNNKTTEKGYSYTMPAKV